MKKLYFLFGLVFCTLVAFSQEVLHEDFSNGQMPPAGWSIDAQAGNWSVSQTANAGGHSPEAKMSWSPQFNTTTRLISSSMDMTGQDLLLLQFRHMIDHYSGNYQIGVAYRVNGGAWTNAWTKTVTTSIPAELVYVPIADAAINSSDFQFCIFFSGSSYNINSWYLDDIILTIPAELDASLAEINVPTYFLGSKDVKGKITNKGATVINSFKFAWQLGDGEIHENSVVGQNLVLGGSYNFTSTTQVSGEPGSYVLKVWVTDVNGTTGADDVPENDTLSKSIGIPTQSVARKPLFEEFTSSTCAPCASFNNGVFNPFVAAHGDEIVLVKYQMNWPGAGDPYYTAEGGQRRTYYGVNAVPQLFVDGKNTSTNSTGVNTAFNNSLANPAFAEISGYYTISGNEVALDASLVAYTNITNASLFVVIFEGITTENHATNGETEFHHVMMRILPDGNGSTVELQSGVPMAISHVVDMTGTNVEEMEDLQVAIFLQDNETQEIFQAAYATLSGALISLTPANNTTEVLIDQPLNIGFSAPVRLIGGEELTNDNAATVVTLEEADSKGVAVPFTAEVNESKTAITITPVENLQMSTAYILTVSPVENYNGLATYEAVSHFSTQTNVGVLSPDKAKVAVYPNPAVDQLHVMLNAELGKIQSVLVYNSNGAVMSAVQFDVLSSGNLKVDVNSLSSGLYLMKVVGAEGSASAAFVVK